MAEHFEVKKTHDLLKKKFFWQGMQKNIQKYVGSYDIYQRTKASHHHPYSSLASLPVPDEPWQEITMDFIVELPPSKHKGNVYNSILVMVNWYTKMVQYLPTNAIIKSHKLGDLLMEEVFLHDSDASMGIVSDRGSVFTSDYWSELCYYMKIKQQLSTAFHSQTDDQTEQQNQTLKHYLHCYSNEQQLNWAGLLLLAEFIYNWSKHAFIRVSLFYAYADYEPKVNFKVEDEFQSKKVPAVQDQLKHLQQIREAIARNLRYTQIVQQKYYNQRHHPREFYKGDLILLNAKNLWTIRPSKKLSHKYIGPFHIKEPVGTQAYHLALPTSY